MRKYFLRTRIAENYKLLSQIFHQLGKNDSAYFYLNQYTLLRDSLLIKNKPKKKENKPDQFAQQRKSIEKIRIEAAGICKK